MTTAGAAMLVLVMISMTKVTFSRGVIANHSCWGHFVVPYLRPACHRYRLHVVPACFSIVVAVDHCSAANQLQLDTKQ